MKATIYSRFSSDKQNKSFSIEEQIDSCTKKAILEGYQIEKVFIDKAQSATTLNRKGLQELLTYALDKHNDLDAIFVYDISRLSRNSIDFALLKRDLMEKGITIHSVQGIPNDSLEGDLSQDLLARVAQYKNQIDALKIKGGVHQRFTKGLSLRLVRGYKWELNTEGRKTLIPDNNFPLYQSLWEKISNEKLTIKQAVKYANKIIPNAQFDRSSMSRFLLNKLYFGTLEYPMYVGESVRGVHIPMISEVLFWQVREIIDGRSHANTVLRTKVNPNYPLTKILYCPECKGKITAAKSKGKREYFEYYFCRNRKTCKYNVQVPKVHSAFIDLLSDLKPSDELMTFVKEMLREKYQQRFKDLQFSTIDLEKDIKRLEELSQTLVQKLISGVIDDEAYKSAKISIEAEILSKKSLLSDKQLDKIDIETILNFVEFYMKNLHKLWQKFPVESKIAIQSSTFPDGLYFEKGICRTPRLSPAFKLNQLIATSDSHSVLRM